MFWTPNQPEHDVEELCQWWPGADYVDIVGMDAYPSDFNATFESVYGAFYNKFSVQFDKHFAIGETGTADVGFKEAWVTQLANTDLTAYPCFKSASWFEFNKQSDFRIIMDQSAATVSQTLSNFQVRSFDANTPCPAENQCVNGVCQKCSWGCLTWDCSPSSPCQTGISECQSGVCKPCSRGCLDWPCSDQHPCQGDLQCLNGVCSACTSGCLGWSCSASQPCQGEYGCVNGVCRPCALGCEGSTSVATNVVSHGLSNLYLFNTAYTC